MAERQFKNGITISQMLKAHRLKRGATTWLTVQKHLNELVESGEATRRVDITGLKLVPATFYTLKSKNL